jgi:hypothetical protein
MSTCKEYLRYSNLVLLEIFKFSSFRRGVKTTCAVSLWSKPLTFGSNPGKMPNIRPKPNIRWFLPAEYSVLSQFIYFHLVLFGHQSSISC